MKLARKKMNYYYLLTDSLTVYHIAIVLHPGMKLEYFHNQKWEAEWVEETECLVVMSKGNLQVNSRAPTALPAETRTCNYGYRFLFTTGKEPSVPRGQFTCTISYIIYLVIT
jgi:hypothetical protein